MDPQEERDLMRRRVRIQVNGPEEAVISIMRGPDPSDSQSLTFEQVRQLMMDLQDALFKMGTRRGK